MKTVVVLATLDTKGAEAEFIRDIITKMNVGVLIVDTGTGIAGPSALVAGVSREQVAQAADTELDALLAQKDKGATMAAMTRGTTAIVRQLYAEGRLDGVIALGGAQGTGIGTAAMRALPLGVPKLMVSTVASGGATFGQFVGTSDIAMLHSVADIAGLNQVSRTVLSEAAGAIAGMVLTVQPPVATNKRAIGMTMVGITTACATRAKERLEGYGYEVVPFHGNGVGPKAMEELVESGVLTAVLDMSPHDATDYIHGGLMPAHAERFRAQVRKGVPIVVVPGATDILLRGPFETVSEAERTGQHVIHNSFHTHIRTTPEQLLAVGRMVGECLKDAGDRAVVYIPLQGYSQLNIKGGPLFLPEADRAFTAGVRETAPELRIVEIDAHINDAAFAEAIAQAMHELISSETALEKLHVPSQGSILI